MQVLDKKLRLELLFILPGVSENNARFKKPGPPIIVETQNISLRAWGLRQGLLTTFFSQKLDFTSRNDTLGERAYTPRILTIKKKDGISGLMRAHTRWAKKYRSMFDQILSPLLVCKKLIMSPKQIWLHFGHIEKILKKSPQKLVNCCFVFWNFLTKLLIFPFEWEIIS